MHSPQPQYRRGLAPHGRHSRLFQQFNVVNKDPEGMPIRIDGKYLTVWQKQADGAWMITADMFNADGPPTPVEQ